MKVDNFLRELLFLEIRLQETFDFLEALLAVCITGGGTGASHFVPGQRYAASPLSAGRMVSGGGRCRACSSDNRKWTKESSDLQCVTDSSDGDCGWNEF